MVDYRETHERNAVGTIRVDVANIEARSLAHAVQDADLAATVLPNFGAGAWGIEEGASAILATNDLRSVILWATRLLIEQGEQACLLTVNGRAAVLWADGSTTAPDDDPPARFRS